MSVDLPPTPKPSSSQTRPAFISSMAALVDWFYTAMAQFNTDITALNFNSTNGTSSTSIAIGTGSKSFVADTSKSWVKGMTLKLAKDASNWMLGEVNSYNSGTGALDMNIRRVLGSGTYNDWTISLAAPNPEGSVVFLGSVEASASAQIDIENDFDEYDCYRIIGTGIHYNVATTVALRCRLKIGGSYDTGSNYQYSDNGASGTSQSYIQLASDIADTGGVHIDFIMDIFKPSSALPKTLICNTVLYNGTTMGAMVRGNNSGTGALTGVRFYPSTANITGGKFSLYGIKNA